MSPRTAQRVAEIQIEWRGFRHLSDWQAHNIRQQLISEISLAAHRYLGIVKTFMAVLPLLGLLGTVTGMIETFQSRLKALGVAEASICIDEWE